MSTYPHIFSPGRIGPLQTKNRIKYAATETNFPYGDGYVSDREVAYMEAQARGGAGIVTTQGAYMDEKGEGKGFKGMMAIYHDRFIPGLARIAEVIRKHDALSCLQLLHCGREGGVELDYCVMPSVVPQKLSYFKTPRVITKEEIKQSVADHVRAARRGIRAGFDMIELSGIVGYLLSTFISRYTNRRDDEYGGSLENRCRLMVETIQAVKTEIGDRVPLGIRLCGTELLDDRGGNTLEESIESFRIAEQAGADYVSVTVGWHESSIPVITRDVPMGHWLWVAEAVKKQVGIPVMMAFRQFLPHIPEKAMAEGKIDFWEACRPMIADPELPNKVREGREEEIIPCIACNVCFSRLYYHQPIMCSVRPSLGHEGEERWGFYGFPKVSSARKVVVVGGGPAGLQCAAVAAQRGHDVTLLEKEDRMGGSVLLASEVDAGSDELMRSVRVLEGACRRHGVEIRPGTEGTAEVISSLKPDTVVIAAGGTWASAGDVGRLPVLTAHDVMEGGVAVPSRVAILGGGGTGLGAAVYLIRRGTYRVTIIEEGARLGRDVNPFYLWRYTGMLRQQKAVMLTGSKIREVKGNVLFVTTPKGEVEVEVDALIQGMMKPENSLARALGGVVPEVRVIGDAKAPRRLQNAIHDGYRVGMEI